MSHVWFGYFWPSLQGNGPEDLFHVFIEVCVIGLGAKALRSLHGKVDELHQKADHIIKHHPQIPDFHKETQ